MIAYLIIPMVISSFLTMKLATEHKLQTEESRYKINDYQILVCSLLFGSLGYFCAFLFIKYRSNKRWFIYIHGAFLLIQLFLIYFFSKKN